MPAKVDISLRRNQRQFSVTDEKETCRKLVSLGYGRHKKVRLYGQEMNLTSDPFPAEGGISVEAVQPGQSETRLVKLPLSVLQVASSKRAA